MPAIKESLNNIRKHAQARQVLIEMPICSGLDAIRPIKEEMPDVKIVMLTSFDDDDNLFEAMKRGGFRLFTQKS